MQIITQFTILLILIYTILPPLFKLFGYKPVKGYLGCGLYGFAGDVPANLDKLKILGLYNMARGDDSCGISIDNKVYKGIGSKANFFDFIQQTSLPLPTTNINIGHTRKATTGAKSEANCHPFAFYGVKEDKKTIDKTPTPYAIAAHNGTIRNVEELKKKYGYSKKNYAVDSIYLLNGLVDAKINHDKIKILNDYEGFAACLWYFPGEDILYAFRGKSESGEDTTGERPLFYWKVRNENKVYISSLKEALLTICDDEEKDIQSFEPNIIYAINKGVVTKLKTKITRGTSTITTVTYVHGVAKLPDIQDVIKGFPEKVLDKVDTKDIKYHDTTGHYFLEIEPYYNPFKNGKIIYSAGKYHLGGQVLGGDLEIGEIVILNEDGVQKGCKDFQDPGIEYGFWNGWLCKDIASLNALTDAYKNRFATLINSEYLQKQNQLFDLAFVRQHCLGIVWNQGRTGGYYELASGTVRSSTNWTDSFIPMFNQGKTYKFSSGYFMGVTYKKPVKEEVFPDTELEVGETNNDDDLLAITILQDTKNGVEGNIIDVDALILNSRIPWTSDSVPHKVLDSLKEVRDDLQDKVDKFDALKDVVLM